MGDSYSGTLRVFPTDTTFVKKRHMGMLRIEDDKVVFLFNNGDIVEIKFEDIKSIVLNGSFQRPLITLKDGKGFIFCILATSSGWGATVHQLSGRGLQAIASQADQKRQVKLGNNEVFNTLKYLIKKNLDK